VGAGVSLGDSCGAEEGEVETLLEGDGPLVSAAVVSGSDAQATKRSVRARDAQVFFISL